MPIVIHSIKSQTGRAVKFGSSRVVMRSATCIVRVINSATNVTVSHDRYSVSENSSLVIPISYVNGATADCISVSSGTVMQDGIHLDNIMSDIRINIVDTKHKVTVDDATFGALSSVTPLEQFATIGGTATFALAYASGYTESEFSCTSGTISNGTLSVPVGDSDITVTIRIPSWEVSVTNNVHFVTVPSSTTYVQNNGSATIPVTYNEDSDASCVSSTIGTVSSSGLTVNQVTSDLNPVLNIAKVQVNAINNFTAGISAISPTRQYVTPNTNAIFELTYQAGITAADVSTDIGTLSGTTLTVPVTSYASPLNVTLSDNSIVTEVTIGNKTYGVCKIGTQYWTTEYLDLDINDSSNTWRSSNTNCYYYQYSALNTGINNWLTAHGITGWHVPTEAEFNTLVNFVKQDQGISNNSMLQNYLFKVGSLSRTTYDSYGLSLTPAGAYNNSSYALVNTGSAGNANIGYVGSSNSSTYRVYMGNSAGGGFGMGTANGYKVTVRLVKNA